MGEVQHDEVLEVAQPLHGLDEVVVEVEANELGVLVQVLYPLDGVVVQVEGLDTSESVEAVDFVKPLVMQVQLVVELRSSVEARLLVTDLHVLEGHDNLPLVVLLELLLFHYYS